MVSEASRSAAAREPDRQGAMVPRRAAMLGNSGRRRATNPDAFLRDRRLFGDLADVPRFVAAYRATLRSLHERVARATLEALAGPLETTTNHSR